MSDDAVHDCCLDAARRYYALQGHLPMFRAQELASCYHSELYVGAALTIVTLCDEAVPPHLADLNPARIAKWAEDTAQRRRAALYNLPRRADE